MKIQPFKERPDVKLRLVISRDMSSFDKDPEVKLSSIPVRERQLENMLNAIPVLISYIDRDLRYQFMNSAYERWFGIEPSSAVGKTIAEVLGEETYLSLEKYIGQVLAGKTVNFEAELPYKGGARAVNATYIPDVDGEGSVRGFSALVRDITDQLKAERTREEETKHEVVKQAEYRYLRMINEVQDYAMILLSKEGIVENWNTGARKIKGYEAREIIGKHFSIFYPPEDRQNRLPEKLLRKAAENNQAYHEGWRIRKDGTVFWGSVLIIALHDDAGDIIGFGKVTRDLTERKLNEDRMSQYAAQLEFQNRELEQFAYVASHDLQEPIRKIRTFNERILEHEQLSPVGVDYFKRSISAANRMQRLIDDLLAYSRTNMDSQNLEEVNLNNTFREILTARKESIEEHQIQITMNTLPVVYAIPFQMSQLFDNLISNSIKYRHPDRRLEISIVSQSVWGSTVKEQHNEADITKEYHMITVTDNGIGFEPHFNEKIFEIFQRLHGISKLPGSGIGLAICKKIVKNHHGYIHATGRPNAGATFVVYLPNTLK